MPKAPSIPEPGCKRPQKDFYRLLVVDDEPVARNLLKTIIKKAGYVHVDEATSGDEALAALEKTEYHVVLLDKNMPGKDGLEVLELAKPPMPSCEFIMITAYGSMETAIQAMDLGAFSYVTKPFSDVQQISSRVERALDLVAIRLENAILMEQLQTLIAELDQAEDELAHLRQGTGRRIEEETIQLGKIREAVCRLRRLATQMEKLRTRATGKAATVFGKMGEAVASVADILESDGGSPGDKPPEGFH